MESIHIKAKNFSNVFVESGTDDEGEQEIYLSVHIVGGHTSTRMTADQAVKLIEALQASLVKDERVV